MYVQVRPTAGPVGQIRHQIALIGQKRFFLEEGKNLPSYQFSSRAELLHGPVLLFQESCNMVGWTFDDAVVVQCLSFFAGVRIALDQLIEHSDYLLDVWCSVAYDDAIHFSKALQQAMFMSLQRGSLNCSEV